jgi:hypothetical protein
MKIHQLVQILLGGREQSHKSQVISVIKDLFHVNMVIPLAMKWKEAEDKASEQTVIKQMQGVQEDKMSCEKEVRTQEKENNETRDQKEGEESIKLGLNEQMQEAQ